MRQFLYASPLFAGLTAPEIDTLTHSAGTPRTFARGDVMVRQGERPEQLVILLSGNALVYKAESIMHRILMSRLQPGEMYGMATLFYAPEGNPTEIVAEKACETICFSKAWLLKAFEEDARLMENYITLLSERIHFLNRRIDVLAGDDLKARLLRLLATQPREGAVIRLPYSLSQLADHLGAGRASLYRVLDTLVAEGVLRRDGRRIEMLDPSLLH